MTRVQWVGALLGVAALISFLVLTPVSPLTSYGMRAAGVLMFTVIWWVFGPVDVAVTSALCVMLLAFTGTLSPAEAYRGLGDPLIWFLVGVFGIGRAMELSGVFRRFALFLMTRGFVQRSPWILPMLFLFAASLTCGFMSWLAVFVIFMTILAGIFEAMGYRKGDAMPAMFIMALAWGAEIGSVITPAGSALNPTIMSWIQRDTGHVITYFQWMGFGVPMWIMRFGLLLLVFRFIMRPDVASFAIKAKEYFRLEYDKLGRWSAQEKITLGVLLGTILLWALPGMLDPFLTPVMKAFLTNNVGLHVPALVGASLLCLVRPKGRALLTVPEWMSAVEWGTIILVAAILVIGELIGDPSTGIPQLITGYLTPLAAKVPLYAFLMMTFFWATLQTNFMSNLATMGIVYAVMGSIGGTMAGVNPVALGMIIRCGAMTACALPSATAVTAIAVGSGWVPVPLMARYGFLMAGIMWLSCTIPTYLWAGFVFR